MPPQFPTPLCSVIRMYAPIVCSREPPIGAALNVARSPAAGPQGGMPRSAPFIPAVCVIGITFFCIDTVRLASHDAGRRHRGRSKPTPRPQRRRQLGTGPADKRHRRKHACRLAAPNGGANSSWQVGRQGPASTTHGPIPRPALKDRECQPGTRLKSAAKPLKISQVQSKTAKFRVGHRNQAEGRGMSEAVTVEGKPNQYNAKPPENKRTVVAGLSRRTHHHGAGEWPPSRLRRRTS